MFLYLRVQDLLGEILKLPIKTLAYEKTAKIADITPRQASESFRKKKFSLRSEMKINLWLHQQGVNFLHSLPVGSEVAVGWKCYATAQLNISNFFLPKTLELIGELAEKDLSVLREYKGLPPSKLFDRFKEQRTEITNPELVQSMG